MIDRGGSGGVGGERDGREALEAEEEEDLEERKEQPRGQLYHETLCRRSDTAGRDVWDVVELNTVKESWRDTQTHA